MISIIETQKMTGLSVASACSLGLARSSAASLRVTGLSGISAVSPLSLASLPVVRERNERPIEAPAAAVAKDAQAQAYAFAAAGAGAKKQTQQHHTMWAFRGPEPWSDPA
ncbi:hypothetical protein AMK21_15990 [Streptomyces sp. CB00316]|uniref:hypothetical protein n=1 Tax=unclassified Streptomyces TaxID=2593676 RepID=UPI00093C3C09|nr:MULTISPECIES: hypothetical protein [unclassified Streptomyces]MBT2376411.1 hypothetical protein [Streptomyces sp. ISL-111]MBT2426990.1 hypothetical protein [Streptomyces sp. ISL-112]MBT2460588.1 hypothetical protein [Streptomyces sp. ISL-63]OKJ19838.1 hypothetical protein AMK21_15990 [Streptomyces sp. CB00316]